MIHSRSYFAAVPRDFSIAYRWALISIFFLNGLGHVDSRDIGEFSQ